MSMHCALIIVIMVYSVSNHSSSTQGVHTQFPPQILLYIGNLAGILLNYRIGIKRISAIEKYRKELPYALRLKATVNLRQ